MSPYLPLSVAIVAEVVATTAMKSSDGFTRLWPSLIVVAGYMVAFYFLSMTFRTLPTGIAYAIWAGAGCAHHTPGVDHSQADPRPPCTSRHEFDR